MVVISPTLGPPPFEQNSAPPNLSKNIAAKAKIATKSYKIARVSTKSAQDSHKNCKFLSQSVTKSTSGPHKMWLKGTSCHFILARLNMPPRASKVHQISAKRGSR